jgi:hypothetical protein
MLLLVLVLVLLLFDDEWPKFMVEHFCCCSLFVEEQLLPFNLSLSHGSRVQQQQQCESFNYETRARAALD